ncbi:MAG TPA: hypothetical protein VFW87_08775, partial [Pirellulales bacterium]|nr:hypothetical protein [Pirellulales bacterium]
MAAGCIPPAGAMAVQDDTNPARNVTTWIITGVDPGSGRPTPMQASCGILHVCGCQGGGNIYCHCIPGGSCGCSSPSSAGAGGLSGAMPGALGGGGCGCGCGCTGSGAGASTGGAGGSALAPHLAQLQAVQQYVAPFAPGLGGVGSNEFGAAEVLDFASGNLLRQWMPPLVDAVAPTPVLTFNSAFNPSAPGMPPNWLTTYHRRITNVNPTTAALLTGTGASFTYTGKNAGGVYAPPDNAPSKLVQNADGTWTETQRDGSTFNYSTSGALATLNKGGGVWTVSYDNGGRPHRVTDPAGRFTTLTYVSFQAGWRLRRITDAVGRISTLGYGPYGSILANLASPAAEVTTISSFPNTAQMLAWTNPQ